jgi:hypothetical protein
MEPVSLWKDNSSIYDSAEAEVVLEVLYDRRSVGVCWCGATSLTRRWACNLLVQLLLGLSGTVILGCKSHRTHVHSSPSYLRIPKLGGQVSVFIFPKNMVAQFSPPGFEFPFCRLLQLAGLRRSQSQSILRPTVSSQYVLISGTHLGPETNFPPFYYLFLGCYGFVYVGCPLWWEVGSVIFSCCQVSPAQSFSGSTVEVRNLFCNWRSVSQFFLVSSPRLGPMTRFYIFFSLTVSCFLTYGALFWRENGSVLCSTIIHWLESRRTCLIWDCPNLEGHGLVLYISPRNRVAQLYPRRLVSVSSPLTTPDNGGGVGSSVNSLGGTW